MQADWYRIMPDDPKRPRVRKVGFQTTVLPTVLPTVWPTVRPTVLLQECYRVVRHGTWCT